jgi:ABC-type bacteriocin/lantibiotic exporter with double-glycine peptidase domain
MKKPGFPIEQWPSSGSYEIINLKYRYRDNAPLIIRGLTFSIRGYEKIGVIGRTGAGKSTLTLGLLRILEVAKCEP